MRRFLLLPALVLALAGPCFTADVHADSSTYAYSFQLGFATITNLLLTDNMALAPTDNEGHNPQNGDGLQHAVSIKDGKPILLVWRKADNWTAATDGYTTWVNGPNGLQKRLNTERFGFEANPDKLATARGLPLASGTGVGNAASDYSSLLSQYEQAHPVIPPPVPITMQFPPIPPGGPTTAMERDEIDCLVSGGEKIYTLSNGSRWNMVSGRYMGNYVDGRKVVVTIGYGLNYSIVRDPQTHEVKPKCDVAHLVDVTLDFSSPQTFVVLDLRGTARSVTFYKTVDPVQASQALEYYFGLQGRLRTIQLDVRLSGDAGFAGQTIQALTWN